VSLFLQVIDVGTLASYRLGDAETGEQPAISLRHVFSPGAFLMVPFARSALSAGFGVAWAPRLRQVEVGNVVVSEINALRVGFVLAADIPLYRR
jgi:hypothetical protein